VRRLHALTQPLELAAHDVRTQVDALVADGQEADAHRPLNKAGPLCLGSLLDEAGELPIGQREAADDDAVADDVDLRAATHAWIVVGRCDS